MLSGRALLFAGIVAFGCVLALWVPSPALEVFSRLLLVLAVLAIAVDGVLAARRALRGRLGRSVLLPLGRQVPLPVEIDIVPPTAATLALRALLPPGVDTPTDVQLHRHPGDRPLSIVLPVRAVALGEHRDIRLPARVLGPLGLTWWRRMVPLDGVLRVVPDPATRTLDRSRSRAGGTPGADPGAGGADFYQLRRYRAGDPRRRIAWRASARAGELLTREVMIEQRQEIMLMIDAGRSSRTDIDGLPRLGHFVNLASQLIRLAARSDDSVGLIAYADQPLVATPPLRAASGAPRLQRELAQLAARAVESNPLLAVLRLQALARHRTLVVLMTDIDDTAVATQFAAALGLIARRHLPLVVDLESVAVAELADAEPESWLDPWVSLAAQEFRHGQRANASRLAQLGCQVVLVRPALAENRLAGLYDAIRTQRRV